MILSDGDIRRRLEVGDIVIDPLDDPELQIQPASVDLRLGREFLTFKHSNIQCIHPERGDEVSRYVRRTTIPGSSQDGQQTLQEIGQAVEDEDAEQIQGEFILHPGDFVLATTKERVEIPPDLIAHVEGRSSLGRLAIVVHASLPYDEAVFLWTPEEGFGFHEIGDVVEHERPAWAVAFDPKTLRVSTHRVTDYITNPSQRIHRVTLESGRQVHVTADHNLFTLDEHGGVTRIPSEEAEGTRVMVPGTLPKSPSEERSLDLVSMFAGDDEVIAYATDGFGEVSRTADVPEVSRRQCTSRSTAPLSSLSPSEVPAATEVAFTQSDTRLPREIEITPEFGWVLGRYIAEGSARRKQLQFSNTNAEYLDRVASWFETFDIDLNLDGWTEGSGGGRVTICSALWSKIFRRLAGTGGVKHIPARAWNWPEPVLYALLDGLMDGDGRRRAARDTLSTANEELANRTQYLATRLGLSSSTSQGERETYIRMSDLSHEDVERSVDTAEASHNPDQSVPNPSALLRHMREEAGMTMKEAATAIDCSSKRSISNLENEEYDGVHRNTLRKLTEVYGKAGADTTRLEHILRADVRFDRVESVEETDRVEPTYDLEVQPNGRLIENFLGGRGGVFLSNTAGLCDPGYEGQITLELSNLGTAPVALTPEMRIAQLTFTELSSPAERPYGAERGSKYQGQKGPQASRIQRDREFGGDQ